MPRKPKDDQIAQVLMEVGTIGASELAKRVGLRRYSVQRILDRMEAEGRIIRLSVPAGSIGRRSNSYRLLDGELLAMAKDALSELANGRGTYTWDGSNALADLWRDLPASQGGDREELAKVRTTNPQWYAKAFKEGAKRARMLADCRLNELFNGGKDSDLLLDEAWRRLLQIAPEWQTAGQTPIEDNPGQDEPCPF